MNATEVALLTARNFYEIFKSGSIVVVATIIVAIIKIRPKIPVMSCVGIAALVLTIICINLKRAVVCDVVESTIGLTIVCMYVKIS